MKYDMSQRGIAAPPLKTVKGFLFILLVALTLAAGLALASPALGAELSAQADGQLSGTVTVRGQGASGIAVELRQRTNAGADSSVASATTDANGIYAFPNVPSAPNDAFYYVRLNGAQGTLAAWYTFPIIYVHGSDFTVPTVEFADVNLREPRSGQPLSLPGALGWEARTAGETYRVFVYPEGKVDKPVLDSGSLGVSTEYAIGEGALPDGAYEAVVQVRDAVAGYGQSQTRFHFAIGTAPPAAPADPAPSAPTDPAPAEPQPAPGSGETPAASEPEVEAPPESQGEGEPVAPEASAGQPQITVNLSADKTEVQKGGTMVYKVEVQNVGAAPAEGVVVTNLLPSGLTVDTAGTHTSVGAVAVQGNSVTAQLGDIAPNAKAVVEIPVSVGPEVGTSISTQASAEFEGTTAPVQSNAYIAQVAEAGTGTGVSKPQENTQAKPAEKPVAAPPKAEAPKAEAPKSAPKAQATPTQQARQNAPMPQTGGTFPTLLAVALVVVTLSVRYLRTVRHRRV